MGSPGGASSKESAWRAAVHRVTKRHSWSDSACTHAFMYSEGQSSWEHCPILWVWQMSDPQPIQQTTFSLSQKDPLCSFPDSLLLQRRVRRNVLSFKVSWFVPAGKSIPYTLILYNFFTMEKIQWLLFVVRFLFGFLFLYNIKLYSITFCNI